MAASVKFGLLKPRLIRKRPLQLLDALYKSAQDSGVAIKAFKTYQPCDVLVVYGWGGKEQQAAIAHHGGRYVALDLGYWERDGATRRKWRVSIDGFHPPQLIMRGDNPGSARWLRSRLPIYPNQSGGGHILLIGNGPKSNRVVSDGWALKKMRELRQVFPGQRILYRPKPSRPQEQGLGHDGLAQGFIDDELRRCSLVVCRHSNVAVDACRLGVPVVCEDGAAAAIYPRNLRDWQAQPTLATRTEFLHRLAWWQWSISDIRAGGFWEWLGGVLDAG